MGKVRLVRKVCTSEPRPRGVRAGTNHAEEQRASRLSAILDYCCLLTFSIQFPVGPAVDQ